MSRHSGTGQPPRPGQFAKGRSGNPGGRPRKAKGQPEVSLAFDILFDRSLQVMQGGQPRQLGVQDALELRIYQQALAGSRPARRKVLAMIARRDDYLRSRRAPDKGPDVQFRTEYEGDDNADAAMEILGIVSRQDEAHGPNWNRSHIWLSAWAVQLALKRRQGSKRLTAEAIDGIRQATWEEQTLCWPRSMRP